MVALAALAAVAVAGPRAVTVDEAATLGMPRLHEPFADCDCVGLTWEVEGEDVILDVPRTDVLGFRQNLTGDGQHELWLLHASGAELLLERGPCIPIDGLAERYGLALSVGIDRSGLDEPACGDVTARLVADVAAFEELLAKRNPVTHVDQLEPVALLLVTNHKGEATERAVAVQRGWVSLRPRLSQCLTLGEGIDDARLRLIVLPDGTVTGVRLRRGGTGTDKVDQCLVDSLAGAFVATPPERAERLRATITMP